MTKSLSRRNVASGLWQLVLASAVTACNAAVPPQTSSGENSFEFATQEACDAAIAVGSQAPQEVVAPSWHRVYQTLGDAIGNPLGVDWNSRTGVLAVFDWQLPGVVLFDRNGNELRRILSAGPGPNELAIRGIMGGGNRLAWENDTSLLVADGKGILRLAAPRWQPDLVWSIDTLPGAFRGRVHLRVIRNTVIVGWTNEKLAMYGEAARGTIVELQGGSWARRRLDRWRAFPQPAVPEAAGRAIEPYLFSYRKGWDAAADGRLVLLGKKAFGVCWFHGDSIQSVRGLQVSPFQFDEQARISYLSQFSSRGKVLPRELRARNAQYEGRFPPHGPWYQTLWAIDGGVGVVALRLDAVDSKWLDVYSNSLTGAVRSTRLPDPGFTPFLFRGDTIWGLTDDSDAPPAIAAYVFGDSTLLSQQPPSVH
jgi:hypothetical protein